MEITLETIYQQLLDTRAEMKADKAEIKAERKAERKADKAEIKAEMKADKDELKVEMKTEIGRLESKVDSVKTWFISLSLSTILVVTAIMTAVVTGQLN